MRKDLYVSVDVEATGPIPGEFSLCSLGAVIVGRPKQTFYIEFQPLPGAKIDQEAIAVGGFTEEGMIKNGRDPYEAMNAFASWLGHFNTDEQRAVFASFGTFDWMYVQWYCHKFLKKSLFGPNGLDIKSYATGVLGVSYSLAKKGSLPKQIRGDKKHTHNALEDAIEQAEILERLMLLKEV